MRGNILYIVVPCFNEEEVLPETARRLGDKLRALMNAGKISPQSRVLFVNDGSGDQTWAVITRLHRDNPLLCGLDLSRNRGHQNALLAGLMAARGRADMAISMDADLQDDVDAAGAMVDKYLAGADIVYGVRSSRKTDTFFKRTTAEAFYRLMDRLGAERASAVSLGLSAALYLASALPLPGILAVFLFNMTMPVTLWAAARAMPGAKGFTFGLLTFALFLGFLPSWLGWPSLLRGPVSYGAVAALSLLLLWLPLRKGAVRC